MAAAAAYVMVALAVYAMQHKLIYFPSETMVASPEAIGLSYEDVWLTTDDGIRLHGWFVPAGESAQTALFFHGNAGNISHRLETLRTLHALGLNVLIIDYRGFGQSEGRPDERGTYQDALAAWHYVTRERAIDPQDIIVHGRSLGGAIAAWLASTHEAGGLVLESTFTSVPALARRHYWWLPVKLLARIHYPTDERIGRIESPVLIAHGRADEVIPFAHGERLYALSPGDKQFLELDGRHNDGFIRTQERYEQALSQFIQRVATMQR